jgi:beta-glucanase (GH16 family)
MYLQKKKITIFLKVMVLLGILSLVQLSSFAQIFIQSEDYDNMEGIQTEACTDFGGGLNVGYIDGNDWMEYDLDIPMTGDYIISLRAASLNGGGGLNISSQGVSLGNITIPSTAGWQDWQTVDGTAIPLEQGLQSIRFTATSGGFNLNWFEIKLSNPVDNDAPTIPNIVESTADVHTIILRWNTSNDPTTIITGYKIFRDNDFLAFAKDTSFILTKLPPETEFNLSVKACDLAGNESDPELLTMETTAINWDLAWSDEFNGTEVDNSKWNFQVGGGGWGNGEAQYYTDGNNSSVENGCLIIEARQETVGSNQYTSSRMNNANKGDFLYGRIEVRAKLPSTGGTWPAIWTLPTDWIYGNWPDAGEMDIMEHTGNNLNYVFGTIHTGAYNHQDGTQVGSGVLLDNVVDSFHIYTLEWYPDHLDWYYDDQIIFTYENEYKTFAEWPFDTPHHLLINIAVGGGLGGTINHNGVWPQQMKVDYVRIYDFDLGAGDTIAPSTPTNLQAAVEGVNVELTWNTSIDNEYVEKYYIFQNNQLIDSIAGTIYMVKFLDPLTEYTFGVQAKDFGGNFSDPLTTMATTEDIEKILIPGQFEAEDYLNKQGMEAEPCTDIGGGVNMAFIDEGDWLNYYVDVANDGEYFLATRAASQSQNGNLELLNENEDVLVSVETPVTGGWQNWETTVSESFNLNAGVQRIRIKALSPEFNLNWFAITTDSTDYSTAINSIEISNMVIYPNPFDGEKLFINLGKNASSVEVCIYTIEGKVAYQQQYEHIDNHLAIEGLSLNSGLYILTIKYEGYSSQYKLISK